MKWLRGPAGFFIVLGVAVIILEVVSLIRGQK